MKKYIGTKTVSATPAWRVDGKVYPKDGEAPRSMNREDGYKVVYEDGYESWSPKDVFEKAYKIAETPVDRMQIETSEVNGRYVKLSAFIDSGRMDETVDDKYNKCLLEMQCCTMFDYIRLVDTHVHRMALELGLTNRKQADMRTALEITKAMKEIFPNDPARGDFALFGYGIEHQ